MKKDPFSKALSYAYRLLSIRERSEREIRTRFREKGYGTERVDEIVKKLKEENLLDDARFAREWIKSRSTLRPKGALAIRSELLKKGLEESLIENALKDAKATYNECEIARTLADKKLESLKNLDDTKRRKSIYGYLARRGFSFDIINDIIDTI